MKNNLLNKLLSLTLLIMGGAFLNPAWAETVTYKLTITASDFNTTSYAANNNEKTSDAVCTTDNTKKFSVKWTSYQVMKSSTNMQWQKSKGYIYNSTDLGTITSVTVTSSAGTFTTYYGTSAQPSSGDPNTGKGFFKTSVGSAIGTTSKVEVVFQIEETTCATPTFSPAEGVYGSTQSVTISTDTEDASIYYTINGNTPTSSSTLYEGAISVSSTTTIKAIAVKDGMDDSDVATATFTIAEPCATPTFSVAEGTYTSNQNVSLSCATDGATIYYTTNGDTPTSSSTAYSSAITVSKTTTIKAIAVKDGMADSDVATATYTINKPINDETFTFSEFGYANGATVSSVEGEACTLTFAKASGSYDPKYYDTGTGVRMYDKNTLTISSGTKTIQSIEFTFDGDYTTLALVSNQPGSLSNASSSKRTWTGSASSVHFTTTTTNRIQVIKVTYDNRAESDLTKIGDITLDFNGDNTDADLTDYFTSTSTGAYTYTVADETVIENDDKLISALKVGTTTVTVSQAADATYKAGEITINVTVNDTRTDCVKELDLASAKAILKGDIGDLSANATKDASFTGTINYTYASANEEIFYIDDTEYLGAGIGATTVTVTATPTGGNAANYKPVSAVVDVTVNGTNSISLDLTSKSQKYTAGAFTLNATVPTENYNGTVTAESSNTAVATVSVKGTTVTVTPEAIGSANITVTAGTDTYYLTTASESCSVTITAPEGGEDAATGIKTTFDDKDLNYSGTGMDWETSKKASAFETSGSARGVQFGAAIGEFTLTSSADNVTKVSIVLSTNESGNTVGVSVGGNNFSTTYGGIDATETLTLTNGMSKQTVDFTGTGSGTIIISINDTKKTVWVRSITIESTISKTLNSSGYATFCSEYPLDFSDHATADYSAWEITNISESAGVYTITFNQLTGAIKGGQGILLKGTPNATVTLTSANSSTKLNDNKLVGTLAPTYVEAGEYYGLSGQNFVPVAASTVPAGKALLPASALGGGSVKAFNFVFEDNATGIRTVETVSPEEAAQIFDLSGRRLNKMQKGINIVNGKKVLY